MEGKTAIALAHQVNAIARLDCILVLDQSSLRWDAKHFELLERNGLYARFWDRYAGGLIDTDTQETAE